MHISLISGNLGALKTKKLTTAHLGCCSRFAPSWFMTPWLFVVFLIGTSSLKHLNYIDMFGFWIRSVLIICWLIPSECWGARFKIYFYPYSSLETRDHPDMDPGPSLTVQLIRRQALKMHRIRMEGRCLSSVTGAQRRAESCAAVWESPSLSSQQSGGR